MKTSRERIMEWPLKADNEHIRGAADGYHVATISSGMNDREEYARLFANAPTLLVALRTLADEVTDLRGRIASNEYYNFDRVDNGLSLARTAIASATKL